MSEILIDIFTQELAHLVVAVALSGLGLLGAWVLQRLGSKLGAERMKVLQDTLAPAIGRALARAEAEGLSGEALRREAEAYLQRTMKDTLKRAGAKPEQVRERVAAEDAIRHPKPVTERTP